MAELKTRENRASVTAFLNAVEDPGRRADCKAVMRMMKAVTGAPARMWGESIVGFGRYHYVYKSGREGDWLITGFSPRKRNLTLYIMPGCSHYESLLADLGKHKTARSCLYLTKLDDVDQDVLREIVARSVADIQRMYECG